MSRSRAVQFGMRRLTTTASDEWDPKAKRRMIKFALIAGPLTILGGLSSLIVHSPDNRHRIEPYLPGFGMMMSLLYIYFIVILHILIAVQFLREKIGLADEDETDRVRVLSLLAYYNTGVAI